MKILILRNLWNSTSKCSRQLVTTSWSSKSKEKNSNSDYNIQSSNENLVDKILALELRINQLAAEMERINNKIRNKLYMLQYSFYSLAHSLLIV